MNKTESSDKCRKTLDRLYIPIKQKLDDHAYGREGGLQLYKKDVEYLKAAYLEKENLGPMQSEELDKFLKNISDRPVKEIDRAATANANQIQDRLVKLSTDLKIKFVELESLFKKWEAIMSKIIELLKESTDKLVASRSKNVAIGTVSTALPAVGIIGAVSGFLVPFTLGISAVIGAVVGAATAAAAAGTATGVGIKLTKVAHEANEKVWNELSEKLMKDNDCKDKVNSTMKELIKIAKELGLAVEKVDTKKAGAVSSKAKAVLPMLKAVATLGDMPKQKEDIIIILMEKDKEMAVQKITVEKDNPLGHMREMVKSIDELVRPLLKRQYPSPS